MSKCCPQSTPTAQKCGTLPQSLLFHMPSLSKTTLSKTTTFQSALPSTRQTKLSLYCLGIPLIICVAHWLHKWDADSESNRIFTVTAWEHKGTWATHERCILIQCASHKSMMHTDMGKMHMCVLRCTHVWTIHYSLCPTHDSNHKQGAFRVPVQ